MRCWGRSTPADTKGLEFERSDCEMDTQIFVSESLATGSLGVPTWARAGSSRFAAVSDSSLAKPGSQELRK